MERGWASARNRDDVRLWREVITPLAQRLEMVADEIVPGIAVMIEEAVPGLAQDEETVSLQLASVRDTVGALAGMLVRAGDPRSVVLTQATIALIHSAAHRNIGLTALLRTSRLGHEVLWRWFVDQIATEQPAERHAPASQLLAGWAFAYLDAAQTLVEQVYEVERDSWLRSSLAVRAETVDEILSGKERDARRAGERLQYDLFPHHLGVVVWLAQASDPVPDPALRRDLDRMLGRVAQVLGATERLSVAHGPNALIGWMSKRHGFATAALRDLALGGMESSNLRVAIGREGKGLLGFRSTQLEAGHARRVAGLLQSSAGSVTSYADVALLSMATVDGDQAAAYVSSVLGALAAEDETARRAAETLAVYLEEDRSRKAASLRLHVHPNTVIYRIRQAEQILGRPLDVNTLDLRVALALLPAVRRDLGD